MSEWFEEYKDNDKIIELKTDVYWRVKKEAPITERSLNAFTNLLKKRGKSIKPVRIYVSFDGAYLGVYFIFDRVKNFNWHKHVYDCVYMMLKKRPVFRDILVGDSKITCHFSLKNQEDIHIDDGSIYFIKEDDFQQYLSTYRDLNGV